MDERIIMKAIIVGADLSYNKGGPALFAGCVSTLKENIPDIVITFLSTGGKIDIELKDKYNVNIIGINLNKMIFHIIPKLIIIYIISCFYYPKKVKDEAIQAIIDADVYIDISGIIFSDYMNIRAWFKHSMRLLPGILARKKLVKYPHASGPHKNRLNRLMVKYFMNKVDLIITRGRLSKNYYLKTGIKKNIFVKPDIAFSMKSADEKMIDKIMKDENIPNTKFLIGLSISKVMYLKMKKIKNNDRYEKILVNLINHIIEKTNATILLVPHSSVVCQKNKEKQLINFTKSTEDDIWVSRLVKNELQNKSNICIISDSYSPEELKGVISRCDVFISSRFHAMIASLGSIVPTMVIGWSHKYYEIMEMFNQQKFVVVDENITQKIVNKMFDRLWMDKENIRNEIGRRLPDIINDVQKTGNLVYQLVNKNQTG